LSLLHRLTAQSPICRNEGVFPMKNLRYLVLFALCFGLTQISRADDFKMNILDPAPGGVAEYSNTFSVTFESCSALFSPSNMPGGVTGSDGCFEGYNASYDPDHDHDHDTAGETWTSLTLTFPDNAALTAGEPAVCGSLGAGIFSTTNCTPDPVNGDFVLSFSDGAITPGETFLIVESGVKPNQFPEGTAAVNTVGPVPEPNSAVLSLTGFGAFGMLVYAQRRRVAASVLRS
jgi:hypothetical protein